MPGRAKTKHRSGCPVSKSLEIVGDRWSLLIIRDMMIRGVRNFKEFQQSGEGIASNILADRLRKLTKAGMISSEAGETDGRKVNYRLTQKGIDLAPVLLELLLWGARYDDQGAPSAVMEAMAKHREAIIADVRRRWRNHDYTPLQSRTGEWLLP